MIAVQLMGTNAPEGDAVAGRAVESRRGLYRSSGLNGQSGGWGFVQIRAGRRRVGRMDLAASSRVTSPNPGELTREEKRHNLVRLVFGGDENRFQRFCALIRDGIPADTQVVLRGSAITGKRWKDGARFDADGPGTSDLDLTLVGDEAIKLFKPTGFFVPGIHSRPISPDDPDIAPALTPLREALMTMVNRPVNIQASRDAVMHFRGGLLHQPYLVLFEKPKDKERTSADSQL
jgi:hypothetical protein